MQMFLQAESTNEWNSDCVVVSIIFSQGKTGSVTFKGMSNLTPFLLQKANLTLSISVI